MPITKQMFKYQQDLHSFKQIISRNLDNALELKLRDYRPEYTYIVFTIACTGNIPLVDEIITFIEDTLISVHEFKKEDISFIKKMDIKPYDISIKLNVIEKDFNSPRFKNAEEVQK